MRQRFEPAPGLPLTPIEKIVLPIRSRDELPPILAGLQWIWTHPTLKAEIFALLEAKILAGKKATGRTGMDLLANPRAGRRAPGSGRRLGSDGRPGQSPHAHPPDARCVRRALG